MLTIADCRRRLQLEFFLGTKTARRVSLKKMNLRIDVLTRFREALIKENELLEKFEQSKKRKQRPPTGKQ